MSVNHCKAAFIIFRCHLAGRIGTKGPHFVIKGGCVVDQLCFIQIFIQKLHNLVTNLHPDTDIHGSRSCLDSDFFTFVLKPVSPFSSYCGYDLLRIIGIAFICLDSYSPAVFHQDFFHHSIENKLYAFLKKMLLQLCINFVAFFRTKMSDGTFHQLQISHNGPSPDFPDFSLLIRSVNTFVCSEFQVNIIGFPDQLQCFLIAENIGKITTHIR